ncbi:MAG: phosphatase PAP2 family protein [Candidatus Micrarchaeota archaeon]
MDSITALAYSLDYPWLKAAGWFIDDAIVYAALVLLIVIAAERRDEKRLKILASLVLAFAASFIIKSALAIERPCAGEEWCRADHSFPSIHASVAFALMTGFIGKRSYPLFLLFALFVSFTRLNIGVHYFVDIAAALPVALVSYYVTDIFWKREVSRHGPRA